MLNFLNSLCGPMSEALLDVPVCSIVGTQRHPIDAPEDCSFREAALALRLNDWSMEDLAYLEEPIGNRLMKARGPVVAG